jgi:hypothetical protein
LIALTRNHFSWFGTNLGDKNGNAGSKRAIDSALVGKYMQPAQGEKGAAKVLHLDDNVDSGTPPAKKSKRQGSGFGNFEGW